MIIGMGIMCIKCHQDRCIHSTFGIRGTQIPESRTEYAAVPPVFVMKRLLPAGLVLLLLSMTSIYHPDCMLQH